MSSFTDRSISIVELKNDANDLSFHFHNWVVDNGSIRRIDRRGYPESQLGDR